MAAPGTAYDDPVLGRDPQVGHMDDYVETDDDNGGVHLNSGIPNRAFQLAATAIGGNTWAGAGAIWYAALTGGAVGPRRRLRDVRRRDDRGGRPARRCGVGGLVGGRRHRRVRRRPGRRRRLRRPVAAWSRYAAPAASSAPRSREQVDLDGPDDERVGEVRDLVAPGSTSPRRAPRAKTYPDMYSYVVRRSATTRATRARAAPHPRAAVARRAGRSTPPR